jgi:signal transduction histidine kinase
MPDGGTLTLAVNNSNGGAKVTIRDTGCGIARENLSKIFDPLFSTKVWGMGFGLAIVKMIVERHGGEITVESEEDKGTSFSIFIPD